MRKKERDININFNINININININNISCQLPGKKRKKNPQRPDYWMIPGRFHLLAKIN